VLTSSSSAASSPSGSYSSASGNGVEGELGNGALVLVLLHTQASSDGRSQVSVASINGHELDSHPRVVRRMPR